MPHNDVIQTTPTPGYVLAFIHPYSARKWTLKLRNNGKIGPSNPINKVGFYLCHESEGSLCNGYLAFCSAVYHYHIKSVMDEKREITFREPTIFAFPTEWRYSYGPSNVRVGKDFEMRAWIEEASVHAAVMHYIALDFDTYITTITEEEMAYMDPKDVYSFIESNETKTASEDCLFGFICKYVTLHKAKNLDYLLNAIRYSYVSTEKLLNVLQDKEIVNIANSMNFASRILKELNYRGNIGFLLFSGRSFWNPQSNTREESSWFN